MQIEGGTECQLTTTAATTQKHTLYMYRLGERKAARDREGDKALTRDRGRGEYEPIEGQRESNNERKG